MVAAGIFDCPHEKVGVISSMMLSLSVAVLYLSSLFMRIRDVKAVMKSATVWQGLSLSVESIYVTFTLINAVIYFIVCSYFRSHDFFQCVFSVLICMELLSLGLRSALGSMFVFWNSHERRIVESMKISHVEVSNNGAKEDEQYKDIYERVLEYFEKDKPFLNGNLTINDIVAVVFTNKLYISRAISQHTGRNFCQFVNYHRVMYSVDCFRRNPDLKVTELWSMCGFNTIVSYNMAFKLFMGENPSDWCRKERIRIFRRPK
jgi:AraC-like DNA-binding protein